MNRINVASEAVQITVNDAGDTITLNVQDQRFMHTVTALVSEFTENAQTYKAKCEEIAAMPHDTNEEKFAQLTAVAAVSNEICSMLKEKVDNVFGTDTCKKVFGDIVPSIDAFADFFNQLSVIIGERCSFRMEKLRQYTEKYSA